MTDTNENIESSLPTGYEEHAKHFNEPDLWKKLRSLPKDTITQIASSALLLRELLIDGKTPLWIRGSIIGVLGYLILPLDLIPDPIPGIGFVDDIAALALIVTLCLEENLISEDIRSRAMKRMPSSLRKEAEEQETGEPS